MSDSGFGFNARKPTSGSGDTCNRKLSDVTKYAVEGFDTTWETAAGLVKGIGLLSAAKAGKTDCKQYVIRKAKDDKGFGGTVTLTLTDGSEMTLAEYITKNGS
jgi:hypothetical protein